MPSDLDFESLLAVTMPPDLDSEAPSADMMPSNLDFLNMRMVELISEVLYMSPMQF